MREISGDLHIVDYKTKMVIASLKPEDYIEDLRHWELKDNADILDIKLLDESPFLIYFQQKNLILKETSPGVITPYVITEIAKDSTAHTATVYASGEWIKLDKDAYISPQKITSKDAAYYMNFATARTVWEVGIIEAVGTRTMTIDTFTSPLRFIKEVATLFDNVEIQYRIVMNPTKPPTRYIDLVKKRGRETDKEITLGKDLLGIKRMENSENIITALVPFVMGRDADGNDKLITIESVNNGLQYIVDDAAYQRWNVDGKHLFGFYTPETDNEDMAPARLLTLAKTELKKRVDTIVSYEVDSVDISRVFGYEHEAVGEGDTIRIIDEGMTPTLYLEARAVAGDESRKDKRKNKYTFGNFVEIINPDEALRKLYQKMLTMIGDKVPKEWFGALETKLEETKKKADTAAEESQTAKDLANATKDYMDQNLVDIIESVTPPTANLKDGKTLWSDTSDPANKVLKLWKGGAWIIISPDTKPLNTALTQAQNDIIKAKQDITTNKGLLDTAKSELQGNINTEKQRITDLTTTVGKKVDKTWIDQQLLDKADKSGVYTKDYIDQNTIGKQVYETDKAGNVQKFTDMNTDITRNATAIKSKAEQSSLDTTNNNVTGVTNRVTTVEQTATGLTTRMGSAEGKINTATGDITNLKTKTNTIEQTANGSVQKIEELTSRVERGASGINIIRSSDFKNFPLYRWGGVNLATPNSPTVQGMNSIGLHRTNWATGQARAQMTHGLDLPEKAINTVYTWSTWIYVDSSVAMTTSISNDIVVRIYETAGTSPIADVKLCNNINDVPKDKWVFLSKTFKLSKTVDHADLVHSIEQNGKVFIAMPKMELGEISTGWSLAPIETVSETTYTKKTNEIINTVDENSQKLTAVETTVAGINDNVTNLLQDSGTFEGATTDFVAGKRWYLKGTGNSGKISAETFQGNTVFETQSSWAGLGYNFKDLIDRAVVKLNDKLNYSFYARLKGLPDGQSKTATFFFKGTASGTAFQITNKWQRFSVTFTVTADMLTTSGIVVESYMRTEINENTGATAWYQATQPQLTIGDKLYTWRSAPEDNATIVKKTNELTQTVEGTISRVSAVESRRTGSDNLVKASSDKMVVAPKNLGNDADNYNYVGVPATMQMDRTYTISARVKFTAGTDTHITVYPYTNGVSTHVEIKDGFIFHTFKKINVNTTQILLYSGKAGTTRSKGVEFTEIMVTEGDGVVAYAPPSPTIDEYTQKTTAIEQTATGLRTDINSVTNRTTAVENRAGTLESKTSTLETKSNTLRSDVDGNITAINSLTETVTYAGENFFNNSSSNNEFPVFYDDPSKLLNKATDGFFEDYYILTCSDYTDAFYQIGGSALNNMHGFKSGDNLVMSMDLMQDLAGTQTLIFQHDGTSWSEAEVKTHNILAWTRVEHAFKLKANTKGIMIKIRFPRVAGANTKKIRFKKLKLEYGSIATPWKQNSVEVLQKSNTIKQTTDENSMKLTSIDASGIAGANIVYNSDFSQRPATGYPDGWAVGTPASTSYQAPWGSETRASVFRINRTNLADTDPNSIISIYSNKFPVTLNQDYTWSVWMHVPVNNWAGFKTKMGYIMEYYKADGTRVQYQDVSLTASEIADLQAGKWTRIVRTLRPTTAGITHGAIRLALFHNGDIYYRMPQVELGTVVTGWNKSTVDFAGNYQFSDLNQRSNEIKQTLDGTVSSVSSISQTVGQHTTQITQQGTTITQMNNEIGFRVKTTEMTDYIGKLGAENELRNTAFETKVINATTGIVTSRTPSLDKWNFVAGKVTAETTRNREGYNSAKILVTGETADKYHGLNQSIPASISSGDYVFGAWFYVQDKALLDQGAVIKLQFFNGATASTTLQTELAPKLVNNGWVYAEVKITAPATTITTLRADIWVRRNGTLWISQPMLQYGSNASAFMEHPQDYVNYDALIGEVAKKVATMDYNTKITTIESSIKQANNEINLRVLSSDVYKKTEADGRYGSKSIVDTHESSITLLKNQIISKVEADGIASAINQTAQAVLIQASKINLDGAVTAKSIQSQRLVGATISTLEQNQIGGFVEMNAQNFSLRHRTALNIAPLTRGYLGFMPNVGKNGDYIRTSLVLGNNYDNANNTALEGSIFIEHTTPELNKWSDASARIGIAKSRNADTTINVKSEINFRSTGTMDVMAREGAMHIYGRDDMTVSAGNRMMVSSSAGYFELTNGRGMFPITNQTLKIVDKRVSNNNDNADTDVILGNSFMIRSANDSAYLDYGLQIKKINGNEWANLWAGKVRASTFENTSSRAIKSYIKDIEVDALDTVMALEPKEYYFKTDIEELYRQRQERVDSGENTEPITLESLDKQYGFIAEDVPDAIATRDRKSVPSYKLATITVGAVQQIRREQLADQEKIASLKAEIEAEKLEKVSIQTELNELKGVLISQEDRIAKLEELLLQQLINKK
ncbi:phage tail spike protein [Bacillus cereus]